RELRKAAETLPEAHCDVAFTLYLLADFTQSRDEYGKCAEPGMFGYLAARRSGAAAGPRPAPPPDPDRGTADIKLPGTVASKPEREKPSLAKSYMDAVDHLLANQAPAAKDLLKPLVEKHKSQWMEPVYVAAEADYARILKAEPRKKKKKREDWQLATGNWQPATGNWQLATANWHVEASYFGPPLTPSQPGRARRAPDDDATDFSTSRRSSLIGSGLSSTCRRSTVSLCSQTPQSFFTTINAADCCPRVSPPPAWPPSSAATSRSESAPFVSSKFFTMLATTASPARMFPCAVQNFPPRLPAHWGACGPV